MADELAQQVRRHIFDASQLPAFHPLREIADAASNLDHVIIRATKVLEIRHELGHKRNTDWPYPSDEWIEQAREFGRLARVLDGFGDGPGPEDAKERACLAGVAFLKNRSRTALRLFESAFADDTDLLRATNYFPMTNHSFRLLAAASAVRLGTSGRGEAQGLDGDGRARCRRLALAWLRDGLAEIVTIAARFGPRVLRVKMGIWQHTPFLAPVRPGEGLERHVPAAERAAWEALWEQVRQSYRAGEKK